MDRCLPRARSALLLIGLAFCLPSPASSQTPSPAARRTDTGHMERPRIGLALSGGGARGMAHVGVLRALEELRVPIDFIGGTSMGAIVSALYASGLSPDEIEAGLREVDWDQLLRDKPVRGWLDFRRREDDRRYPFEIEMGVDRRGVHLPGGLVHDQMLATVVRRHTLHAALIDTFAQLPIPFLAVATDVGTGEVVVLERGDLAAALRASSAIPVVFSPVEVDGRLLVDGGLNNNLPVDLVRAMGADLVIAVDVSVPLETVEEIRSLIEVWEQSVAILQRTRVGEQLARADVAVVPELEGFSLFDYERVGALIARGEAAVRGNDALEGLAIDPSAYAAYREQRRWRPSPPSTIASVKVVAPRWLDQRRIADRVRLAPGDAVSAAQLEEDALRLYALGEFERVGYDVEAQDRRAQGSSST